MRGQNQGAIPSELGELIDLLNDHSERLRTLEAPSGEALASTVDKLQAVVANIDSTLTSFIANDVQAIVDARVAIAIASYMSGNVSIGGELFVNGPVTMPNAYTTDLVGMGGARKALWIRTGGRLGVTT